MPLLSQDSFFFIPVDAVCRHPAITCTVETSIVDAAELMRSRNISGVVVTEGGKPAGIISLRDLRDLIAERADEIPALTVRDVMKRELITIGRSDLLFKALFRMAKHNIHRLPVIDADGSLCGVITDTDLLRIQTKSPLYLVQEIESSTTLEHLRETSRKLNDMIQYAARVSDDPQSLIQLINHFYDAMTRRLTELLSIAGTPLPADAAYLALGSEGREEQTLRTDQDSAIVHADGLSAESVDAIRRFADAMSSGLETLGVPLCPGNMMASNPAWTHSISEWKEIVEGWVTTPGPEQMVSFGVFQDLRVIHGRREYEEELRRTIIETTTSHPYFFPNMARNIIRFKPPLGLFGRFITGKRGEERGKVDIKKGGVFGLTRGIGLICLEERILGGTTWSRLERLKGTGHFSMNDLQVIEESFSFLMKLRLDKQLIALAGNREPSNLVDPLVLKEQERVQLRAAFRGVSTLYQILTSRYQLNLVSR